VVSRKLARPGLVLLAVAAVELAVVASIGRDRHEGALSIVAALALAPVAVGATSRLAWRLGGQRLGVGAAIVYALLPWLGHLYFFGPFLAVYDDRIVPALVGLEHTGWFALGVGIAAMLTVAPERVAAVAGVLAAAFALVAWVDGPWGVLWDNFHETAWSQTFLAFLPVAALVGAARRSPWLAGGLGGWLAFVVLRGLDRDYGTGGFWVSVAGAAPAIAVLLSSLVYLAPRLRTAPQPDPAR
jgi:hypothetical protein